MSLGGNQASQSRLLRLPTSSKGIESTPPHSCYQGRFSLACGGNGVSSPMRVGVSSLDLIFNLQHSLVYFSAKWNCIVIVFVLLKLILSITGVITAAK